MPTRLAPGVLHAEDSGSFHADSNASRDFDRAVLSMRDSVAIFQDEMPDTWREAAKS